MDSGNPLGGVLLILKKYKIVIKRVKRMFMKYTKIIIRDNSSIFSYQMDHFVKKSTFWSKWSSEISPVASP